MKLDYKGLAILIIVVGAVVAGAFSLGMKQGKEKTVAATPQGSTTIASQAGQQGTLPGLSGQEAGRTMPPNHPSTMERAKDQGVGFSHFRVGNRNVKGMLADGDKVWVGTSGGVIRYDLKSDKYDLFDVNNKSLLSNGVFHVSRLDDRIFIGTYGGGMSVFDLKTEKWRNYNIPDGLADQFVYDVLRDKKGDVWIATWSGVNLVKGGDLDDPSKWTNYTIENTNGGLPNDWVYGAETGKNGEMWFATEGGLARLKDGKWTNWQHKDGLGADYEIVKADNPFKNDPSKVSQHHAAQQAEAGGDIKIGYNPNYIVSMVVDDDGNVWCGTWGGGLSRFDGKNWTNYTVKDGLPGNHIFTLKLDEEDRRLWIGTNKGLARLNADGKGFSIMTTADGLFADNVFSITKASDGTLWVGSFGGVARISNYKL